MPVLRREQSLPGRQTAHGLICRHCARRYYDAIAFVRRQDGIGYAAACKLLGLDPADPYADDPATEETVAREPLHTDLLWWLETIDLAELLLWRPEGQKALAWLRKTAFGTIYSSSVSASARCRRNRRPSPAGQADPWLLDAPLGSAPANGDWKSEVPLAPGQRTDPFRCRTYGHSTAILTEGEFDRDVDGPRSWRPGWSDYSGKRWRTAVAPRGDHSTAASGTHPRGV